jgi:hypothetical protein
MIETAVLGGKAGTGQDDIAQTRIDRRQISLACIAKMIT